MTPFHADVCCWSLTTYNNVFSRSRFLIIESIDLKNLSLGNRSLCWSKFWSRYTVSLGWHVKYITTIFLCINVFVLYLCVWVWLISVTYQAGYDCYGKSLQLGNSSHHSTTTTTLSVHWSLVMPQRERSKWWRKMDPYYGAIKLTFVMNINNVTLTSIWPDISNLHHKQYKYM